jgi:serine/threonine protein kinase
MESFQQTFILENLNSISDSEKLEKKRSYNSKEISSRISLILNQAYPTGSDMKAVFYLIDSLFLAGSAKKVREKGLYSLTKNIRTCIKKMEHLPVKSKEGLIYITHFFSSDVPVIIKIPRNARGIESKVREYFIGIKAINTLRYLTPSFVYTLGAFLCPKPSKTGEIEACDSSKNTAFVLYEKIPGESVQSLLTNDKLDFKQFLLLLCQLLLGLEVAQREVRFTHFDMHTDNVMVRFGSGDSSYATPLDMNTYIVNNPEFIPVVIDFGAATSFVDGKYIGSYDYISHGMLNFMVPGYDMYKFLIYCARKTQNLKLKDRIISIFRFYGEDDPYFIVRDRVKGIEAAAGNYCKELTFSNAANRTPLMLLEWLLKEYSSKLKSKLIVKERRNYISVQYSKIIKEFEDIFSFTRIKDGKDKPDNALALIKKCINSKPSYVMSAYGIKVLEKYNNCLESNELKGKIDLLYKELVQSKDYLLDSDSHNLEKVFDIKIPSQEELDLCVSKVLKIKIRHSKAKEKEDVVKNLENLLLYQQDLKPYLQFYFTILELNDRSILKDWINRFKISSIYLFHIKNVSQNERATRWSQTLMASII